MIDKNAVKKTGKETVKGIYNFSKGFLEGTLFIPTAIRKFAEDDFPHVLEPMGIAAGFVADELIVAIGYLQLFAPGISYNNPKSKLLLYAMLTQIGVNTLTGLVETYRLYKDNNKNNKPEKLSKLEEV